MTIVAPLPADLFNVVGHYAAQRGLTISDVVRLALIEMVRYNFHPYTLIRNAPIIDPEPIQPPRRSLQLGFHVIAPIYFFARRYANENKISLAELVRLSIKKHLSSF
jgi:hypothetical protein